MNGKYQGNLSADREEAYGRLFANYLRDPENFFIISSDFCHWGQRFGYTFHDTSVGEIYQVIGPKFSFHILINPQPSTPSPQPSILNPQSSTLNPQP